MLAAAAIDGRIDADSAAVLEAHLGGCPECQSYLRGLLQDLAWLAAPGAVAQPPSRVREAVLEAARAPTVPKISGSARPWPAFAAVAIMVFALGGSVLLANQRWSGFGAGGNPTPRSPVPSLSSSMVPPKGPTPVPFDTSVQAGPCAPRPAGLTAWWPGEDPRDMVGGRDLQLRGGASLGPGLVGEALTFDGLTAYAEVPHDPALDPGTQDFTVMLWVRFGALAGEQVLIEQWRDPTGTVPAAGWTLTKVADQGLLFTGESNETGQQASTPPIAWVPGVWYHVAARRSGQGMAVFINGRQIGDGGSAAAAVDFTLDTALLFGRRGNDSGFLLHGQLDDVQLVVGRALFQTEIEAVYRAGSTGVCRS